MSLSIGHRRLLLTRGDFMFSPGICSGDSPALLHLDFTADRHYTRTDGQIGVTRNDFSDVLSFTGAAGRTYAGPSGQLVTAGLNEPRVRNHIDTGSGLFNAGILVEGESTNLALQSNGFDTSPWAPTATTVTPNAGTSPDGTNNAYSFSHTGTAAQLQQVVTSTTSINYTVSVFVRRVDWQWFRIFADTGSAWFDLDNGVIGSSTGPVVGYDIESIGNSWFRVHVTVTASSPSFIVSMHLAASDGSGAEESGVSAQIYGAQLEEGGIASSYIPTAATSETRLAETLNIGASVLSSTFGGSMPASVSIAIDGHITYADNSLGSEARFTSWIGTDEFIVLRLNTIDAAVGTVDVRNRGGGTTTNLSAVDALSPGANVPFSVASRHGSGADSLNGAVDGTALTAASPPALADLIAFNLDIAFIGNMTVRSMTLIAGDLSDAELVAATTEGSGFNPLCPFDPAGGAGGSFSDSFSESFSGGT